MFAEDIGIIVPYRNYFVHRPKVEMHAERIRKPII